MLSADSADSADCAGDAKTDDHATSLKMCCANPPCCYGLFFGASSETGLKYHICRRSLCDAGTSDPQNWSTAVLISVLSRAQLWTQFQKFNTWSRGEEEVEVGHLHFILRKMLLVMEFVSTWQLQADFSNRLTIAGGGPHHLKPHGKRPSSDRLSSRDLR